MLLLLVSRSQKTRHLQCTGQPPKINNYPATGSMVPAVGSLFLSPHKQISYCHSHILNGCRRCCLIYNLFLCSIPVFILMTIVVDLGTPQVFVTQNFGGYCELRKSYFVSMDNTIRKLFYNEPFNKMLVCLHGYYQGNHTPGISTTSFGCLVH